MAIYDRESLVQARSELQVMNFDDWHDYELHLTAQERRTKWRWFLCGFCLGPAFVVTLIWVSFLLEMLI